MSPQPNHAIRMSNRINFDCGSCQSPVSVHTRQAGRTTTCPSCGELVRVPGRAKPVRRPRELRLAMFIFLGLVGTCWAVLLLDGWIRPRGRDELLGILTIVTVCFAAFFVLYLLASAPGRIARERSHPQADAISICGWLGLFLTGGIGWIVAMVWAHMKPKQP